jgi:hypothetical protein
MKVDLVPDGRPGTVPSADELAAIVAVLESLDDPAPANVLQEPSRWREAARSFEPDSL